MTQSLDKQLETSRKKREIADNRLAERKALKRMDMTAKFDFTDSRYNTKKKRTRVERGRTQEHSTHSTWENLQGIAEARDIVRNTDLARGMLSQIVYNVVGSTGGKAYLSTEDEKWNEEAMDWYWHVWAPDCDGTGLLHWNTKLKQTVSSALTDGDIFWFIDDFTTDRDGRFYTYTADWLVNPEDPRNLPDWRDGYQVSGGLILSPRGRPLGACIGPERGKSTAKAEDIKVYYFSPSVRMWKPWMCAPLDGWLRGVSAFAPSWFNIEGLKEMRARELETAGVGASLLLKVIRKEAAEESVIADAGGDPGEVISLAKEQYEAAVAGDEEAAEEFKETAREFEKTLKNYEQFESQKGARVEYLEEGDDIKPVETNRPNLDTENYYNDVSRSAGSSLGMGDTYTKMKADRSYTAFRGEMLMTWKGLYENLQKELERDICDRAASAAVNWAVETGQVSAPPPGWKGKISHQWPAMPEVDPVKWITALGKEYGFGHKTPADVLGPGGVRKAKDNRKKNSEIFGGAVDQPAGQ